MKNRLTLIISLALFMLFLLLYMNGTFQAQEPDLSSGLPRIPDTAMPLNENASPSAENVAASYYEKVGQLEEYLQTNPTDTTHILRLARLLQEGHQPAEASDWYEAYLDLNPNDIQSMLDLANTYGESGEWEKALGITDRLLQVDPDNGKALYNKAAILANRGNLDEATDLWEQIVEKVLDNEIVLLSKNALDRASKM